jgi:hypothetical protein
VDPYDLRTWRKRLAEKTCVKPSEPESRGKEFQRPEHVPREALPETFRFECADAYGWTSKPVGMVRSDHELIANVFGG